MVNNVKIVINGKDVGLRLDSFLANSYSEYSRHFFEREIELGNIKVNGKFFKKSKKLEMGDCIELQLPELKEQPMPKPIKMDLDIVYEDDQLLVVNKPAGLLVHMGSGNTENTLVDGLIYHTKGILSYVNTKERPGIVHRIDKDTTGLLVVAKTDDAHISLAKQLEKHSMTRRYFALVNGKFKENKGTVESFLIRDPKNRIKKKSIEKPDAFYEKFSPKWAVTHWEVLKELGKYSYIMLKLETGRTHQIRVHMASKMHPILGDQLYGTGKKEFGLGRQMLHAGILGFVHPKTGRYMEFESELPQDFLKILEKLNKEQL